MALITFPRGAVFLLSCSGALSSAAADAHLNTAPSRPAPTSDSQQSLAGLRALGDEAASVDATALSGDVAVAGAQDASNPGVAGAQGAVDSGAAGGGSLEHGSPAAGASSVDEVAAVQAAESAGLDEDAPEANAQLQSEVPIPDILNGYADKAHTSGNAASALLVGASTTRSSEEAQPVVAETTTPKAATPAPTAHNKQNSWVDTMVLCISGGFFICVLLVFGAGYFKQEEQLSQWEQEEGDEARSHTLGKSQTSYSRRDPKRGRYSELEMEPWD